MCPTKYAVSKDLNLKSVGKPPYKYVSQTMDETKRLVKRALNQSDDTPTVPGPGTYNLPDFPPGRAFSMQSRTLPHGMPPPYNHNSQPDLARKFVPLREQNNGDLIFGRSFRGASQPGAALRKSSEFELHIDKEGREVEEGGKALSTASSGSTEMSTDLHKGYREGDFAQIAKMEKAKKQSIIDTGQHTLTHSRSEPSGVGTQQLHVSVLKAATYYHTLAGHLGKHTPTFLPMAARRMVNIPTKSSSAHYKRYMMAKHSLKIIAQDLTEATKAAIEPLDKEELLKSTENLLVKKIRSDMRIQGYNRDIQDQEIAQQSMDLRLLLGLAPTPPVVAQKTNLWSCR